MAEIIKVDFLFSRFCRDISKFYDKYYLGKDAKKMKNVHLMVLKEKYDERDFSNDPTVLGEQVEAFLTMVQRNVDRYIY